MVYCRIVLLLLWFPVAASAATVLGIVSERSAAEMAAGAYQFLKDFPDHQIILRTPEQLADLSDQQIIALWQTADALVLGAVFGDQAGRLERLLRQQGPPPSTPILAVNSERRITRLSQLGGNRVLDPLSAEQLDLLTDNPAPGESFTLHLAQRQEQFPEQAQWLNGRAYYQGRSPEHIAGLMRWLLAQAGQTIEVSDPEPPEAIRYYRPSLGSISADPASVQLQPGPLVVLLDLDSGHRPGDRDLLDDLCAALEARGTQCFAVLSRWGGASQQAVLSLADHLGPARLSALVSLQDFVVGGGEGRRAVSEAFEVLNVPVLKGIRLNDRTEAEWRLSTDGIAQDQVHYRLAMPELQGVSQPMVLAVAQPAELDARTGIRLTLTHPVAERVQALADRLQRWQQLQALDNADKKVALIYYNHPPGRQNVGADKLDVPESLFEILQRLQAAGYTTGELPEDSQALLDLIQDRGINLLEDRQGLGDLVGRVPSLSREAYQDYFNTLPQSIRAELEQGPLGYLHANLVEAHEHDQSTQANRMLEQGIKDLQHLLLNHDHPAQERALNLLEQFHRGWQQRLKNGGDLAPLVQLRDALIRTGIPGLAGWGEAPGQAMIYRDELLFPGLRFGNIFIGPQPPRGWEISEALLHANTRFPPTHHYVGFYHWLRDHFEADALVYLGRHSTREFLPRRRAGLAQDDYPDLLGGDLPVLYPYIVDGVGEGIQAKRRAMGVMISHLTPPLATTELYDQLLELRQLVETYEAAIEPDSPTRVRAAQTLRERIRALNLTAEIEHELAHGHHGHSHDHGHHDHKSEHATNSSHEHFGQSRNHHSHSQSHSHDHPEAHQKKTAHAHHDHRQKTEPDAVAESDPIAKTDSGAQPDAHHRRHNHQHTHAPHRGPKVSLDDVDEGLLTHEVGHYLTEMQERFMPLGLHVFGRDWDDQALEIMLTSMAGGQAIDPDWRERLKSSPANEMASLLAGLSGQFIAPGRGNDPVRTPEVLPTGRNFHALSGDLLPTRTAWSLGQTLAAQARLRGDPQAEGSEAIILWASDTVRDEGVMIAFGLDMLGVTPQWNSRGIVTGLERLPLEDDRQRRRDALFTTSGLFRDLYEDQLIWLDQAVRIALDGATLTIQQQHPQLITALEVALAPLPKDMRAPGAESLAHNDVAARWVADTRAQLAAGVVPEQAGHQATLRVFGTAPGAYGAGINRLTERSGAWQERSELAVAYQRRMGHAYGAASAGEPAHDAFAQRLTAVGRTYLGRASHLYGLLDNNDGFDFQGGLSLAVEMATGQAPDNRVLNHTDANNLRVESLERALLSELRSRNLNPQWLAPLMEHGYAGARTMGADFLDNLWGWQVTSPEVVRSWVWDAVYDVYFLDSHELGLQEFLQQDHNIHVKTHMQAITLVAAHRGFWEADPEVLAEHMRSFAAAVVEHGLPGGGHTRPDHPTMAWIAEQLQEASLRDAFNAVRASAQIERTAPVADPARITELTLSDPLTDPDEPTPTEGPKESAGEGGARDLLPWLVLLSALLIIGSGAVVGRRFRL